MAGRGITRINWRALRSEALFFGAFFTIFAAFSTAAFAMYHIPSESMLPTLTVGDRIIVNKFAYGYSRHSVPFSLAPDAPTPTGRLFYRAPKRGDVVVFRHPRTGDTMIKRLVGLPGDEIEIREGRLFINGALIARDTQADYRYREYKGGLATVRAFSQSLETGEADAKAAHAFAILERGDGFPGDAFGPAVVPADTVFMLGDNRDNSLDSRFLERGVGFVPLDHLIGRAEFVLFSTNLARGQDGLYVHKPKLWRAL